VEDFDTDEDEFFGTHMHAMDAKGRLVLPSEHRALLEEGKLVMTLGFDNTLAIHPMDDWVQVRASLRSMQRGDQQQRRMARAIYSNASKQVLDKQGRVTIPVNLREICGLTRDVAVVGMGTHIEVWDAKRWAAEEGASRDTYANTTDSLGIGMF
jgi:MraZ protein